MELPYRFCKAGLGSEILCLFLAEKMSFVVCLFVVCCNTLSEVGLLTY